MGQKAFPTLTHPLIENTVEQKQEGSLLGVEEKEENVQYVAAFHEETEYPGATQDEELDRSFHDKNPTVKT